MPTYSARCLECKALTEFISPLSKYLETPPCSVCGGGTKVVITKAPQGYVKGNFAPFRSPVDGTIISTASGLAEHNKRNNVVNISDGYSEDRVLAGDYMPPPPKPDKADIKKDIVSAAQQLEQGYVPPIREAYDE